MYTTCPADNPSAVIVFALNPCAPISRLPDAVKLVTPYMLTASSELSPIWIAFASPWIASIVKVPILSADLSPKSSVVSASNTIWPLVELIVFPSIRILSIFNCPAVSTDVPISMLPKPLDIAPEPRVPTVVNEDVTTALPNVVAFKVSALFILNDLPDAIFQCWLEVQLSLVLSQIIVLSDAPFNVIPPPSAVESLGEPTEPISIFLSSTDNVVEFTVVVVPSTCKPPVIWTLPLPFGCNLMSILVSPPVAEKTGGFDVAAFANVISLTALLVAVNLNNSLPLVSNTSDKRKPLSVLLVKVCVLFVVTNSALADKAGISNS